MYRLHSPWNGYVYQNRINSSQRDVLHYDVIIVIAIMPLLDVHQHTLSDNAACGAVSYTYIDIGESIDTNADTCCLNFN